jgi:hypothetical protein
VGKDFQNVGDKTRILGGSWDSLFCRMNGFLLPMAFLNVDLVPFRVKGQVLNGFVLVL